MQQYHGRQLRMHNSFLSKLTGKKDILRDNLETEKLSAQTDQEYAKYDKIYSKYM